MKHRHAPLLVALTVVLITLIVSLSFAPSVLATASSIPINPDPDKDGVQGKADYCPDVFGPVNNGGCPWGEAASEIEETLQSLPVRFTCPAFGDQAYGFATRGVELETGVYCRQALWLDPATRSLPGRTILTAIFAPEGLPTGHAICLKGAGELVLLPADGSAPQSMPGTDRDGYTCAHVPGIGVVALVAAE